MKNFRWEVILVLLGISIMVINSVPYPYSLFFILIIAYFFFSNFHGGGDNG